MAREIDTLPLTADEDDNLDISDDITLPTVPSTALLSLHTDPPGGQGSTKPRLKREFASFESDCGVDNGPPKATEFIERDQKGRGIKFITPDPKGGITVSVGREKGMGRGRRTGQTRV